MKKNVVFFCFSKQDTLFALSFQNQHPHILVLILAPTIDAQLELQSRGLNWNSYYSTGHFSQDFYNKGLFKKERIAKSYTQQILTHLSIDLPEYEVYLKTFANWLEIEYIEILDSYLFFKSIVKKWQPSDFYLNQEYQNVSTSLYAADMVQAGIICNYFVKRKQVHFFSANSIKTDLLLEFKNKIPDATYLKNILQIYIIKARNLLKINFNKKTEANILIFSGGRNLYFYHELIRLLEKMQMRVHIATSNNSIADELLLRTHNIAFTPISSQESSIGEKEILDYEEFSNKINANISKSAFSFCANKKLRDALSVRTKSILINKIEDVVRQYEVAKKIVIQVKPKLLITTHDPSPSAMPFVLQAQKQNIRTLVLMHGWQDTILGVDHQSTYIAVWGPFIKKWYGKKLKKSSKSIYAVGYPFLDPVYRSKESFWQNKVLKYKSTGKTCIGLLLTMYLPTFSLQSLFLNDLFKELKLRTSQYSLSIRLHPGQSAEEIEKLAKFYNIQINFNQNISLEDFLINSDVVFSWDTTALIWAMIYGKPLFYCAPNWSIGITPVKEFGAAWLPTSAQNLFDLLNNLEKTPTLLTQIQKGQKKFLKEVVGFYDSKSSTRTAKIIAQHIS
jgi:hypothetical protein